jgi:hypothetical protein
LHEALDLQKKNKKSMRLNFCSEPNKDIIDCYSPARVVKTREYHEKKEKEAAAEEKKKYDRRVQRAANTLRRAKKKEERRLGPPQNN